MDTEGLPLLNTVFMISKFEGIAVYTVLGILASNLMRFYWIQKFSDNRKQFPKIKGTYLEQLPIRRSDILESKIDDIVREIINRIHSSENYDFLEQELNQYVYDLYDICESNADKIEKFTIEGCQ